MSSYHLQILNQSWANQAFNADGMCKSFKVCPILQTYTFCLVKNKKKTVDRKIFNQIGKTMKKL